MAKTKKKLIDLKLPTPGGKATFNPVEFWNALKNWNEEQVDMSADTDISELKGNA